jgi:hypothetical protein
MFTASTSGAARRGLRLVVAFAVVSLTACGGGNDFHKVYPVTGKILVDGKPAADCHIYLHRTFEDDSPRRVTPYAITNDGGEFKITSYVTDDGAPPGEYIVTVEWRERSGVLKNNYEGPDRLGGAFATVAKTKGKPGFVVKVEKGPLELPPFNLKRGG